MVEVILHRGLKHTQGIIIESVLECMSTESAERHSAHTTECGEGNE
jgi:hypothetical protein